MLDLFVNFLKGGLFDLFTPKELSIPGFSAYRKIKLLHLGEPVGDALVSTAPEEERARKVALDIPAALAS